MVHNLLLKQKDHPKLSLQKNALKILATFKYQCYNFMHF